MLLGSDEKLIHAVLQAGLPGYYQARRLGIRSELLFDESKGIWDLMEKMAARGRLPSLPEIHTVTGHLISEVSKDPLDVEICASAICKRGLTSQLHGGLEDLISKLSDDPFKARDQLAELVKKTGWSYGEPYSINSRSAMEELIEAYEKAARRGNKLLGLSSPWPTVDSASLGLQPGELTVVFGKRKLGKSWITIAWAVHIWKNDLVVGDKLLFATMEMTPLQVLRRMACIDLRLSWDDFRGGRLTTFERQLLDAWIDQRINGGPSADIVIVGSNDVRTIQDLDAVVGEHKPKIAAVDSFYILGRASAQSLHERILANVQGLKLDIGIKHNIPVLASTQLKGTTSADVLDADSDQAMGAKAIGDYADSTRGLFADDELKAADKRWFRSMESREFVGKDVEINFNFKTMDFSEIRELTEEVEKERKANKDQDDDGDAVDKPRKRWTKGSGSSKSSSGDDEDITITL